MESDRLRRRCAWALTAFLVTLAAAPRVAHADPTEEANTHFEAGVALLRDPKAPRYEEAYRAFKAAYTALPSPKILGNLGLCAMELERDDEAIDAYERYLREVPDITPADREQIQRDLLTLRSGLVRVRLSSSPPGATITDVRTGAKGETITNSYGPLAQPVALGLRHGRHLVTAHLAGYPDVTWELESNGGDLGAHAFEFKAAPAQPETRGPLVSSERPIPTSVIVAGGATVVLGGAAAVFGVLALGKNADYRDANTGSARSTAADLRADGQGLNIVADVFLGAAVISAAVTAYLYFTRPSVPAGAKGNVIQGRPGSDPGSVSFPVRF